MALTKGDYETQGEKAARSNGGVLTLDQMRPSTLKPGSWQCRHWDIGYKRVEGQRSTPQAKLPSVGPVYHNAVTGVISSLPQSDISKLRVVVVSKLLADATLNCWPTATKEHVRILAEQHNKEGYLPRRARLHRALIRITMRHQGIKRLVSLRHFNIVPMTMPGLL